MRRVFDLYVWSWHLDWAELQQWLNFTQNRQAQMSITGFSSKLKCYTLRIGAQCTPTIHFWGPHIEPGTGGLEGPLIQQLLELRNKTINTVRFLAKVFSKNSHFTTLISISRRNHIPYNMAPYDLSSVSPAFNYDRIRNHDDKHLLTPNRRPLSATTPLAFFL